MMARARPTPTAVIGAGRLARALLPLLGPAGHPVVAVADGRRARAADVGAARLVLLAVPDRAIAEVAARLARRAIDWRGRVVLHHAGALGLSPLAALARRGAGVGVLHPLQCLGTDAAAAADLVRGSRARIEGDRAGRAAAARLARGLGLVVLPIDPTPASRAAYHAAAALASNDLVALLDLAAELLVSAGVSRHAARRALLPLARGTLCQLEAADLAGALTGPAARGDVPTLRAHLERLAQGSPEGAEVHRLLSGRLAAAAQGLGALSACDADRVRRLRVPGRSPAARRGRRS
jgi:predicted short-subunit dehydrogenase-like oxidoreductase (DUF2520 family)